MRRSELILMIPLVFSLQCGVMAQEAGAGGGPANYDPRTDPAYQANPAPTPGQLQGAEAAGREFQQAAPTAQVQPTMSSGPAVSQGMYAQPTVAGQNAGSRQPPRIGWALSFLLAELLRFQLEFLNFAAWTEMQRREQGYRVHWQDLVPPKVEKAEKVAKPTAKAKDPARVINTTTTRRPVAANGGIIPSPDDEGNPTTP